MSDIDDILSFDEQQQQQETTFFDADITDVLSLTIENMIEINLINTSNRNQNDSLDELVTHTTLASLTYTIIFGFICAFLCFLTIAGNLIVLSTFRRMRTVGNLFILSLATADLIVGCFVMPIAGIYAIMERWNMGIALCQIWISVDFIASTASIFNLLTLSLDRYWSITSPLQYLGKRTRTRALLLIGFAWGLSLLWVIPIFGWHHFINDKQGREDIEDDKCEPKYTHSKVFKVSTAIINFYLPLLVLISLNGRIYYEIKRRYRSVLLQRHANQLNESITTVNNNSIYNRKLNQTSIRSRSPITITLCDSDRQMGSSTANCTENDSLILLKTTPKSLINNNESVLRVNFKERKHRSPTSTQSSDQQKSVLHRTYSYVDKNHCTQDELTWFSRRLDHSRASFSQTSPIIASNFKNNSPDTHYLHVDKLRSKSRTDNKSYKSNSHKQKMKRNLSNPSLLYKHQRYQTTFHHTPTSCRRCSVLDSINVSSTPLQAAAAATTTTTTTMNIFNLCHCCTTATSAITIHSNHFVNENTTINNSISRIDSYKQVRKISSSSSSSSAVAVPSVNNRKRTQSTTSHYATTKTITPTSSEQRSNAQNQVHQIENRVKQATVWNQQEKAFRQLFAIVFGFTCCFLPYFILYMVVAFCGSCVSERVLTATIWLGYVNSTMNPFLYVLSNKHFRRTFHRLLKRDNVRQLYYN